MYPRSETYERGAGQLSSDCKATICPRIGIVGAKPLDFPSIVLEANPAAITTWCAGDFFGRPAITPNALAVFPPIPIFPLMNLREIPRPLNSAARRIARVNARLSIAAFLAQKGCGANFTADVRFEHCPRPSICKIFRVEEAEVFDDARSWADNLFSASVSNRVSIAPKRTEGRRSFPLACFDGGDEVRINIQAWHARAARGVLRRRYIRRGGKAFRRRPMKLPGRVTGDPSRETRSLC